MSTEPYAARDGFALYCGDCRDVLPLLPASSVDLILTDPPYSEAFHRGARTGRLGETPLVDFASITTDELRDVFLECGRVATKWLVATMDWRHIADIERRPIPGWRFVRFGVWVKPNGAPQFTGDRPGPGWEGILFMHKEGLRMRWNGRGRSSVFIHNKVSGKHTTGKPESLIREFVALFSNPGDTVLDPFSGGGTTLRAAIDMGRNAIGIEIDGRHCENAALRLQQSVLALGA